MENYGISKQPWLAEFLELPNGIPSDDTFRRVFEFINPRELNCCFFQWVETLVKKMAGEIIPIDGRQLGVPMTAIKVNQHSMSLVPGRANNV
jgi:hypothetical protein